MYAFILTLKIISVIITFVTTGFMLYQFAIALFGLRKPARPQPTSHKKHRFAIVVSARNEQSVIGYLIDSLMAQDYPKELFDVIVIADNCTDNTAQVSREHGAIVYERFNTALVGKGFALNWLFQQLLEKDPDYYDAICVFDADNVVDTHYLTQMNMQLCAGAQLAQGYRDSKNPTDTAVSGCYSLYWWTLTRFFHVARNNMGLSAMVSGTGFMFRTDIIRETNGWHTSSLCEDCEFSLQNIAAGRKVVLAYDAVFYDEQPVSFSQSVRQRHRWSAGNLQCIRYCFADLFKSLVQKGNWNALDGLLFLFFIPSVSVGVLGMLVNALIYSTDFAAFLHVIPLLILGGIVLWLAVMGQAILVLWMGKKPIKPMWKAILYYPIFLLSWMAINFVGLYYQSKVWKPIDHTKEMGIEQIKQR